jgi:hypothetical protein
VLVTATILGIAAIVAFDLWRRHLAPAPRWLHVGVLACSATIAVAIGTAWWRTRVAFASLGDINPADRQHALSVGIAGVMYAIAVALGAAVIAGILLVSVSASRARRRSP